MSQILRRDCAISTTMSVIEGRWKAIIVYELMMNGKMRFSSLLKLIDGVSPRMVSKQLKELEMDGMVVRQVRDTSPVQVEYSLTPKGMSIFPVLNSMLKWGREHMTCADTDDDEE